MTAARWKKAIRWESRPEVNAYGTSDPWVAPTFLTWNLFDSIVLYITHSSKSWCAHSDQRKRNKLYFRKTRSVTDPHQGATASTLRGCLWRTEGEGDWIYPSVRQDTHPYRICGYLFKCKSRRLSVVIVSHVTLARAGHSRKKGVIVGIKKFREI